MDAPDTVTSPAAAPDGTRRSSFAARLHAGVLRRRVGRGAVVWSLLELAGWSAFTAYLFVQALAGPAVLWTDSKSYALVASKPFWSLAFLDGVRPPLYPLLLKATGTSTGVLATQAAIAAVAWGLLAWTVGRLVAVGWQRLVAVWVVLAFASSLPVTLWNRSVLSESVSMSLLAFVFAGVIWTARRVTWPRVAVSTIACLAFALTRDAQIWTVAMLGIVVALAAVSSLRTDRRLLLRTSVLAVCLLAVAGIAEWGAQSSHRTTSDISDVFYVRVFPFPARVAWFAAHGMPESRQLERLAATAPATSTAKVVAFPLDSPAYAPLRRWMENDATSTYLLYLASHPLYLVTEPLVRPERAFNFADGSLTFYAATDHQLASPLTDVLWPPVIVAIVLGFAAAYLGLLSGAWRDPVWRVVGALTMIGVLAMLVAWHGDGQEVTRHTIEGFAEIRLGIWILILLGALDPSTPPVSDGDASTRT